MALQLIFVLESDKKSQSDYIYIRSILDYWYDFRPNTEVKVSSVYMGGKGNYKRKRTVDAIESYRKQYRSTGNTYVIYCFDTDRYDSNNDDRETLLEEQQYCIDNRYEFVWFCHDIEEVFLGRSVSNNEKISEARRYSIKNGVEKLNKSNFEAINYSGKKSNLVLVLNKYLDQKED